MFTKTMLTRMLGFANKKLDIKNSHRVQWRYRKHTLSLCLPCHQHHLHHHDCRQYHHGRQFNIICIISIICNLRHLNCHHQHHHIFHCHDTVLSSCHQIIRHVVINTDNCDTTVVNVLSTGSEAFNPLKEHLQPRFITACSKGIFGHNYFKPSHCHKFLPKWPFEPFRVKFLLTKI